MTVTNDELMAEVQAVKTQLSNQHHVWKRAEHVAKHFDVSLGTVKNWKRQKLIQGYKHGHTVIYDVLAIQRDLFQIQN
ncbi:hypothetical protein [uncultured Leuconostoc sp.]|uniref:hypothetical protein n=1 Tax=uncultured Leuconostoc sp. TaxID=173262 RepID=UPI0025EB2EBE|nr:hypothetical protein [uncultured Leuconostoc sp.]